MLELLAPAGSPACALAAFEAGAVAIYAGLARFNARERGENFTPVFCKQGLVGGDAGNGEHIRQLHLRGNLIPHGILSIFNLAL